MQGATTRNIGNISRRSNAADGAVPPEKCIGYFVPSPKVTGVISPKPTVATVTNSKENPDSMTSPFTCQWALA